MQPADSTGAGVESLSTALDWGGCGRRPVQLSAPQDQRLVRLAFAWLWRLGARSWRVAWWRG